MIQQPNGEEAADPRHLGDLALTAMRHWAWAAAEDPNQIADILGQEDTAANRKLMAKILYNLGRAEPPTP